MSEHNQNIFKLSSNLSELRSELKKELSTASSSKVQIKRGMPDLSPIKKPITTTKPASNASINTSALLSTETESTKSSEALKTCLYPVNAVITPIVVYQPHQLPETVDRTIQSSSSSLCSLSQLPEPLFESKQVQNSFSPSLYPAQLPYITVPVTSTDYPISLSSLPERTDQIDLQISSSHAQLRKKPPLKFLEPSSTVDQKTTVQVRTF